LTDSIFKIVACIHDGIILEAPEEETDLAEHVLRNAMIEAGQVYLKDLPAVVDVSVVENWSEK
jgi:DNA polymerase I-like protein with 3'-5' exonuclease and polymerase domains